MALIWATTYAHDVRLAGLGRDGIQRCPLRPLVSACGMDYQGRYGATRVSGKIPMPGSTSPTSLCLASVQGANVRRKETVPYKASCKGRHCLPGRVILAIFLFGTAIPPNARGEPAAGLPHGIYHESYLVTSLSLWSVTTHTPADRRIGRGMPRQGAGWQVAHTLPSGHAKSGMHRGRLR